jgi:hypothetical protein
LPTPAVAGAAGERSPPASGNIERPAVDEVKAGTFLPLDPLRLTGSLGAGALWMNRAVAASRAIGERTTVFNTSFGFVFFDLIDAAGSAAFAGLDDHAGFQQDVVPVGGGTATTAESSLTIWIVSFEVGPRTPLLVLAPGAESDSALVLALFGHYGWSSIGGQRTIDDCLDCNSQDLALPGGAFWRVGAEFGKTRLNGSDGEVGLSLSYRHYRGVAGISREIGLALTLAGL